MDPPDPDECHSDNDPIIEAVSTLDDGNGAHIDDIFEKLASSHVDGYVEKTPNYREMLEEELAGLVSTNKLEMVENRYKVVDGAQSTSEDSATQQSTSLSTSSSSEKKYDHPVLEAIYRIDDGNGAHIDGIYDNIEERYNLPPDYRNQLEEMLTKFVSQNELEKVENRYKIVDGTSEGSTTQPSTSLTPKQMHEVTEAAAKPQELPSTSLTLEEMHEAAANPQEQLASTSMASEEKHKVAAAAAKAVAVSDQKDFEAKEASEAADKAEKLLEENTLVLDLAKETLEKCSKGEKVFLR